MVTTILVICAVVVTAAAVHAEFFKPASAGSKNEHIDRWRILVAGRHPDLGSSNAPLKIVEFSDYQCPFCRDLDPKLQAVVKHFDGKVAVIRYDLPLESIHPHALVAALAAECAKLQGIYEPFESRLFENDSRLGSLDWNDVARSARVPDIRAFSSCLSKKATMSLVNADMAVAAKFGFKSTPVMVVDGNVVMGTQSGVALDKMVASNLDSQ
ncbi:MAG: DsbA family protein [Rhodanobacteraceae bacterium]